MPHTAVKTVIIKAGAHPTAATLRDAVAVLRNGGVVVFPTDTVYGLAANAFDAAACKKIYRLKGRSFHKPLIVMPPTVAALRAVAEVPEKALNIMKDFWPGPLTLIFHTNPLGKMLMGGRADIGARIPNCSIARMLLSLCDFPLATTSANPSGKPSAKKASEAKKYFDGHVSVIIDGGTCALAAESTVVDMTHYPGTVVREGALSSKKLVPYL